jgi:hypothetical protein
MNSSVGTVALLAIITRAVLVLASGVAGRLFGLG